MALDLDTLRGQHLRERPRGQIFLGHTMLRASYAFPRRSEIVIENVERIPPREPVFFAMNHTDRYNYWPFQYAMWKRGLKFTATWVKGKYFESRLMARFMIATNNIPLPSRGYVIVTEFRRRTGRAPTESEYRILRNLSEGAAGADPGPLAPLLADGSFLREFEATFSAMIDQVIRLNREALFEKNLNVLVFPQGTRSKRLSAGHTGLAQMSQHLGVPIVPVGCSGSDRLYPGGSPWSKGGRVVYRVGEPIAIDEPVRITAPFRPLTREATAAHGEELRRITERVMSAIGALVDEEYRAAPGEAGGTKGIDRFL